MRFKLIESREINTLECALLEQHIAKHGSIGARFGITKQVDHIVQVAGTRTFGKRPDLFSKYFLVGVRSDSDVITWDITVGMECWQRDWWQRHNLIGREVKFNPRHISSRWRHRTLVAYPALTAFVATGVLIHLKTLVV